jgi:hypothetical protein
VFTCLLLNIFHFIICLIIFFKKSNIYSVNKTLIKNVISNRNVSINVSRSISKSISKRKRKMLEREREVSVRNVSININR